VKCSTEGNLELKEVIVFFVSFFYANAFGS